MKSPPKQLKRYLRVTIRDVVQQGETHKGTIIGGAMIDLARGIETENGKIVFDTSPKLSYIDVIVALEETVAAALAQGAGSYNDLIEKAAYFGICVLNNLMIRAGREQEELQSFDFMGPINVALAHHLSEDEDEDADALEPEGDSAISEELTEEQKQQLAVFEQSPAFKRRQ